jgi:ribosome-binding protein aMBF1 (putative translation factor)
MAKYSTGGGTGGGEGDSCELCGASSDSLRNANVAGAELLVCQECAPHDDATTEESNDDGDRSDVDRKRRAVQNAARANDVWDGDSSHWEQEGTDYDDDPLPYLVPDYGQLVEDARQDAGLQREELADELGVPESDLLAVEQGRATQAGLGGSLIEVLENRLGIELAEAE